jgi:tripartite ATP-independent transporter DctM subunit
MLLLVLTFFILLILGVPVAFDLGLSALIYIIASGKPLMIIPQRMFAGADSFSLMAIPFFIFAGEIMNRSGVTKRIVKYAQSLVGFISGGFAHVTIIANIIMAGISGSTTADMAAIGGILIPSMVESGYNRAYSSAVNAVAATIGSIIPPSILMILYGSITGISIGALFVAGLIPGLIVGLGFMVVAYIYARKHPEECDGRKIEFSFQNLIRDFIDAIPALIMPLIIIVGILGGIFTATEAGAIAAVYGILVGTFIYKEISFNDFPKIILKSVGITGMAMIIVAAALLFSWLLAVEDFPVMLGNALSGFSTNPNVILFLMIIIMIAIGCFMDTTAAAIIMVPILQPIAASLGLNQIHFALVMVLTFIFGGITPPVGITIYVATAVGKTKLEEMLHYIYWFIAVFLVVILLVAYIPGISLFLPKLLGQQ